MTKTKFFIITAIFGSLFFGLAFGTGGVFSPLTVAEARLYAQPKTSSRVLLKLKPEETAVKLIACRNDWVKIQTSGKTGWLSPRDQCGNPVTTCP